MLWTTKNLTAYKGISTHKIKEVGCGKVIEEYSNIKTRIEFIIPEAKLAFVKLRQTFGILPILYIFDPKYHI